MNMEGTRLLSVTREQAWQALNDPEILKLCVPGCDKIELTGDNQYAVGVAVKIGPVAAKFAGKMALTDIVALQSYTLNFEGQSGAAGFGKGSSQVRLVDHSQGCELSYTVQATVGGKIAQMGQRLIDGVAKSMAEDFFKRFDTQMQERFPPLVAATPVPVVEAPAQPSRLGWWVAAGAVALGLLAWLASRG
jgi:uncharacterized protein